MLKQAKYALLSLVMLWSLTGFSQNYFANGDARAIGNQCYELTPSQNFKLGSVWYAKKLDLLKDFDLEFYLNFGNVDANGADGMVFVLQTAGNRAIGESGGGIGFAGFSPSLGVEFDTWQNTDYGDPSYDHMAIFRDGIVDHTSNNELTSEVPIISTRENVENGNDYLIRVKWFSASQRLEIYVDCDLRLQLSIDLINDIFNGETNVFWGFTSATGGSVNRHVACLRDDIIVPDTVPICKGGTKLLNARESQNNRYRWFPSTYLNDTTVKRPSCSAVTPITYQVEYTDLCGDLQLDTVHIRIDQPFVMDEGEDSLLCDGSAYRIDLSIDYDSALWMDGSRSLFRRISDSGYYQLRAWRGVCYDDDSFNVRLNATPQLEVYYDTTFCDGETLDVRYSVDKEDAVTRWDNNTSDTVRTFTSTTTFSIESGNSCGVDTYNGDVEQVVFGELDIGEDAELCRTNNDTLKSNINGAYTYRWSNGDTRPFTPITNEGTYWLEVLQYQCTTSDTVDIVLVDPPQIDLPTEIILCNNERISLEINQPNTQVLWNNTTLRNTFELFDFEGSLSVKVSNACGEDSATINIIEEFCNCRMWFPNAITPNGNDLNETFKPVPDCEKLRDYNLKVYNRWGELLYETNALENGWDASYKNAMVQDGVYMWLCTYTGIENGEYRRKQEYGTVYVIR
jgi:gliding motility-associated-like protein